jgi:hypothetical protein
VTATCWDDVLKSRASRYAFHVRSGDGNAVVARRLYQERYPGRRCPDRKTFVSIHHRLCEHGNFAPHVPNRGWPRSTTPEVEEDILDVANETPGINTRRVSMQVGVTHSTGEGCKNSCIPTICSMYRPCHYKITLGELCSASGSYNSVVQILTSLPLWYLWTKLSSQEVESTIFTISIIGQMKIHTRFFHHIINSGSPSTSGPVFVVIIYSDPTYSKTWL